MYFFSAKGTEKHIHSSGCRVLQPLFLHPWVMSLPSATVPKTPAHKAFMS